LALVAVYAERGKPCTKEYHELITHRMRLIKARPRAQKNSLKGPCIPIGHQQALYHRADSKCSSTPILWVFSVLHGARRHDKFDATILSVAFLAFNNAYLARQKGLYCKAKRPISERKNIRLIEHPRPRCVCHIPTQHPQKVASIIHLRPSPPSPAPLSHNKTCTQRPKGAPPCKTRAQ